MMTNRADSIVSEHIRNLKTERDQTLEALGRAHARIKELEAEGLEAQRLIDEGDSKIAELKAQHEIEMSLAEDRIDELETILKEIIDAGEAVSKVFVEVAPAASRLIERVKEMKAQLEQS